MSGTKCIKCDEKAVYKHNTLSLCRNHFLSYVEDKVESTIRRYKLMQKDDKICVATSGGKDSLTVLYMTMIHCKKYNIEFFALAIDEGIKDYRDHTLEDLKVFCDKYQIPLKIVSFKERFNYSLDDMRDNLKEKTNKKPCTICGILRRKLLNEASRELKATKLVTGHNLDDEAQSYLMNVLKGNMGHNAGLGPITGLNKNTKFVPRVKPLYFIAEKETRLYAFLRNFKTEFNECPNIELSFRAYVRDRLNEIENKFPGVKQGAVNSFLEILPTLKDMYKDRKEFGQCEICGDPSSGKVCNSCMLEKELCKEAK